MQERIEKEQEKTLSSELTGNVRSMDEPASLNEIARNLKNRGTQFLSRMKAGLLGFGRKSIFNSWVLGLGSIGVAISSLAGVGFALKGLGGEVLPAIAHRMLVTSSNPTEIIPLVVVLENLTVPLQIVGGIGLASFLFVATYMSLWLFFEVPTKLWVSLSHRMAGKTVTSEPYVIAPYKMICAFPMLLTILSGIIIGFGTEDAVRVEHKTDKIAVMVERQMEQVMNGTARRFDSGGTETMEEVLIFWNTVLKRSGGHITKELDVLEKLSSDDQAIIATYVSPDKKDELVKASRDSLSLISNALTASMDPNGKEARRAAAALSWSGNSKEITLDGKASCVPLPTKKVWREIAPNKEAREVLAKYSKVNMKARGCYISERNEKEGVTYLGSYFTLENGVYVPVKELKSIKGT